MRGVVFTGERSLDSRSFRTRRRDPGEVVLEIKASGMCGSDLKFYRAAKGGAQALGLGKVTGPVIAGHEPCGVVAAVGAGRRAAPRAGRRPRDGAPLQGLRRLRALPRRLVAALRRGASRSTASPATARTRPI